MLMNLKYVPHNQSKCFKATTNFFCTIIASICVLSWFPVNAFIRTLLRAELHTLDETIILISGDKVPHFSKNISPQCAYILPFISMFQKNYLTLQNCITNPEFCWDYLFFTLLWKRP